MKHGIKCAWAGGMAFDADVEGHRIRMDAGPEAGGQDLGPLPKTLLMAAAAGCTGMDVAALLRKMRVQVDGFEMEMEGDLVEEHPRVYSELRLVYRFHGKDLDKSKISKAVELSQARYCGVGAMLKKAAPYTYRIEYQD